MLRKLKLALLGLALFSTLPASAQTPEGSSVTDQEIETPAHTEIWSGLEAAYRYGAYRYEEPTVMNIGGDIHGIGISYGRPLNENLMGRLEADFFGGALNYDGALNNAETRTRIPIKRASSDSIMNLRAHLGIARPTSVGDLVAFAGLGIRSLKNRIEGTGSYDRESSYTYLPVGAEFHKTLADGWKFSATAEFDVFLGGSQTSVLPLANGATFPLRKSQSEGQGYRGSIAVSRTFRNSVVSFEPYFERWDIGDSEKIRIRSDDKIFTFLEPKNYTEIYGANLGVTF